VPNMVTSSSQVQMWVVELGKLLVQSHLPSPLGEACVFRGHMSVVGPGTLMPEEAATGDGWIAKHYEIRPGITGLWQVCDRNSVSTEDLQRLDYLYVGSGSMWSDLKSIFERPRVMRRGFGAY